MTANGWKLLSVRLPAGQLRRIKSLAAQRGTTIQAAVREALREWEVQPEESGPAAAARKRSLDAQLAALAGSLGPGPTATEMKREERAREQKDEGQGRGPHTPR